MSMFPEKYGLVAAGLQGGLAMLMAFKMSQLRISKMLAGKVADDEKEAKQRIFNKWHGMQLNAAEYNPLFMVLYVGLHFAANGNLNFASEVGITMGLVGTILFAIGKTQLPSSPNPVGAIGVLLRYLCLGICSYNLATAY